MAEDSDYVDSQISDTENTNDNITDNPTYFVSYNNQHCDDITKSLNAIVLQYLDSCGLNNAARAFIEDCRESELVIPDGAEYRTDQDVDFSVRDAETLLNSFDQDDGQLVLQLWERLIRNFDLSSANEFIKSSFNIRLYVSLIPFYHDYTDEEKAESMAGLRSYFEETTNSNLADEEMLSLFALPYVNDPKNHLVFRRLFEPSWKDKLRESIVEAIQSFYEQNKLTSQSRTDLAQMFINCSGLLDEAQNVNEEKNCDLCSCKIPRNATATLHFTSGVTISNRSFSDGKSPVLSTNRLLQKIHTLTEENKEYLEELRKDGERYLQLMKVSNRLVKSLELAVLGKSLDLLQLKQDIETAIPGIFAGIPLTRPGYSQESVYSRTRTPSATVYINCDENSNRCNSGNVNINSDRNNNGDNVNVQLAFEDCDEFENMNEGHKENLNNVSGVHSDAHSYWMAEKMGHENISEKQNDITISSTRNSSATTTAKWKTIVGYNSDLSENPTMESDLSGSEQKSSNRSKGIKGVIVPNDGNESGTSCKDGSIREKIFFDDSRTELEVPPRLIEQRKYRRTIPDPTVSSSGRSEKEMFMPGGSKTYRMEDCNKEDFTKKAPMEKERPIVSAHFTHNEKTQPETKQKILKDIGSKPISRKKWTESKASSDITLLNEKIHLRGPESPLKSLKAVKGRTSLVSNIEKRKKTEKVLDLEKQSPRLRLVTNVRKHKSTEVPTESPRKSVRKPKDRDGKNEQRNKTSGRASSSSDVTPRKSLKITSSTKQFQWISATNFDIPFPAQSGHQTVHDHGVGFVSKPKLPRSP